MEPAKVWEEQLVIPTYEIGAADKNPMFLEKRVYQGSSGKIYQVLKSDPNHQNAARYLRLLL